MSEQAQDVQAGPLPPVVDDKARLDAITALTASRDAMIADLQRRTDEELAALTANPDAELPADATKMASVAAVIPPPPDLFAERRALESLDDAVKTFGSRIVNEIITPWRQANDRGESFAGGSGFRAWADVHAAYGPGA